MPQMRQQQEERCSGEIFWASSSLSRTLFSLSSILYSWVLHSLLWKVLFWLSICRALWLFLSISLSPTFTVIVLNLFLTPTLALGLSFPFPLPLLSSPQDPPPCLLLPMLFVIKKKKKALNCFEKWLWCLCEVHLHERKERKTRQKRTCFNSFSYSWKSLENFLCLSPYWGSGKILPFVVIAVILIFSQLILLQVEQQ